MNQWANSIEIILISSLVISILLNSSKNKYLLLIFPALFLLCFGYIFDFIKSAYHFFLLVVIILSVLNLKWSKNSKLIIKYSLIFTLILYCIYRIINVDLSLGDKSFYPTTFPVWAALIIIYGYRLKKTLVVTTLIDAIFAYIVKARAVLIGDIFCILAFYVPIKIIKKFIYTVPIAAFILYVFSNPAAYYFGYGNFLEDSASNKQRSLMNFEALISFISRPIQFDENSIFNTASDFINDQNDSNQNMLTVHCLFLAFGQFNGLIPMLVLYICVLNIMGRLVGTQYLPIAIYSYFQILLGPDSFDMRYFLLLMPCCLVLSGKNFSESNNNSQKLHS